METIEMIGWIVLGFVPTYAMLEVSLRKLIPRKRPVKTSSILDKMERL